MNLSNGEKITQGITYKVEFTKAEEVAEMGEYARKEIFTLPEKFDMEDELCMNIFFDRVKIVMEKKNYDTVVLKKEIYEEFVYFSDYINKDDKEVNFPKCELCEQEKHCVSIDVEWTLLDTVCEECWEKYCEEHEK
jgi:hypothetical protein